MGGTVLRLHGFQVDVARTSPRLPGVSGPVPVLKETVSPSSMYLLRRHAFVDGAESSAEATPTWTNCGGKRLIRLSATEATLLKG